MDAKTWAQVKEIFSQVVGLDKALRSSHLDEICAGDAELRREVEELLSSNDEVENFIEDPAFTVSDALPPGTEPIVDKVIGHYRIVREIGRGGMGTVFLAERDDGEFQQEVAIKVVSSAFLGSESLVRFRQERQILAVLTHPNIAHLLDGGVTDDGLPFFVMEYVEGESLIKHADRQNLTINDRLRIFLKICRAFAYAHANLIVHRDVKPSNILVTPDGEPKLLDFGLAKILDIEKDYVRTASNFRALTPAYASPEQIRGDQITTASDIYSLGVVLYELLTGSRPFNYDSLTFEKMMEIASGSEPVLPSVAIMQPHPDRDENSIAEFAGSRSRSVSASDLKGDIDNIVLMAMRSEPERRYSSVEQFAGDIERHLDGLPISATEDTFGYRASKFIRRHRIGIASAGLVLLVLISGIVATLWQARVAQRESNKAQRINTFLRDMLGSASPDAKGSDLKVKDALDEAAKRVRADFANEPDIVADVLLTIGKTYVAMDLHPQGETELRSAVDASLLANGQQHPTTAAGLAFLGIALAYQFKFVEGEEVSRRAVEISRTLYPQGHEDLGVALFALASNLLQKGDYASAEPIADEASQVIRRFLGEGHGYYLATLTLLGNTRERNGNIDAAEAIYRQVAASGQSVERRYRIFVAQAMGYLGRLLMSKGNFTEAERFLGQSENTYREVLGDSNPSIAHIKQIQGQIDFQKKDYSGAEIDLKASYKMFEEANALEQPIALTTTSLLGQALTRSGKIAEGERYLRSALEIRSRLLPSGTAVIHVSESALGECLAAQSRYAEAMPLLNRSYEALRASLGDQDQRTIDALERNVRSNEMKKGRAR